jgi:hypothetical protein
MGFAFLLLSDANYWNTSSIAANETPSREKSRRWQYTQPAGADLKCRYGPLTASQGPVLVISASANQPA